MKIAGRDFEIIGQVELKSGHMAPLVNMRMMSDEEWLKAAIDNAVQNYRDKFGKEPESPEIACAWQRKWVDEMINEHKGEKVYLDNGKIITN